MSKLRPNLGAGCKDVQVIGSDGDLTYREKELALRARLGYMLRNLQSEYRLNSLEGTDTGRKYTEQATEAGDLLCAFGLCTQRQQRILRLWLGGHDGRRLTQAQAANVVGVSLATASRESAAAFRTMIEVIWDWKGLGTRG